MTFKGYHEDQDHPFRRGQEIIIPAGTPVQSTHPSRTSYVTKRKQTIRIHHLGCGLSFCVGFESPRLGRVGTSLDGHVGTRLKGIYGTDDPAVLVNLPESIVGNVTPGTDRRPVFLPVLDPSVVWAGTGGYWCEVNVNLVLEANGVS